MDERLTTRERAAEAAKVMGVSVATLYRYKKDPASIPFGKLVALGEHLAFPIEDTVAWSRADVIQGERRRYELEERIASTHGRRFTVTPSYSVATELSEMTRQLWQIDYPTRTRDGLEVYLDLRAKRRALYFSGKYESFELISGGGYLDFFHGEGRFKGIPKELREKQVKAFLKSFELPHIQRRIHLRNTPELPTVTCYSNAVAWIRVDDITIEFSGTPKVSELTDVFNDYFMNADIVSKDDVRAFFRNPGRRGR